MTFDFWGIFLNMARQCFAQNGVFVDHCPIFYMIVVGSFQLQAFWFYPWCPTDRAEQFICWPLLFFGCTFLWIWEKGRGLFLACPSDCFVLILLLSARQKREKPQTPLTPQEKPQTLTVEKYVFMTHSLPKYSSGTVRWVLCFLVLSMVSDLHFFMCLNPGKCAFSRPVLSLWRRHSSFWKLLLFPVTQVC